MITNNDLELFTRLVETADKSHDGHLTVMKFTTNWRVGFVTPDDRDVMESLTCLSGTHFAEAARKALGEVHS